MTNSELVALLREARESVLKLADEYESLRLSVQLEQEQRDLASRIDAALAAHDAVPPSEETVEWDANGVAILTGAEAEVWPWETVYRWRVITSAKSRHGRADTLDEAQRAALAAAKGMK